jgi:hypothetical protein
MSTYKQYDSIWYFKTRCPLSDYGTLLLTITGNELSIWSSPLFGPSFQKSAAADDVVEGRYLFVGTWIEDLGRFDGVKWCRKGVGDGDN